MYNRVSVGGEMEIECEHMWKVQKGLPRRSLDRGLSVAMLTERGKSQ